MRDPKRIESILSIVKKAWLTNPDLRLMQLLLNLAYDANTMYYVEDEELVKALNQVYLNPVDKYIN